MRTRVVRGLGLTCVLAFLAVAALPVGGTVLLADANWNRVDTPNFVVIGTGDDKALTDVGLQFEGFREGLSRILSPTATATAVPTIVIVFPNGRTLEPFRPMFNGKRIEIGGLFVPRQDVNYVLLAPHQTDDSWRVVFHEYSHLIVNNVAPNLPPWLNEGLAEYYSSFELRSSGREVQLGKPIAAHYRELANQSWLSIPELIGTTHASPHYNEGARRDIFYAQSWLLTHMLLHGQPDRTARLSAYIDAIDANMTPAAAWEKVFAGDDIAQALRLYASRPLVSTRLYTLSEKIARASGQHATLTPADAQAIFGQLLMALGDKPGAAARFKSALALDPASALAAVGAAEAGGEPVSGTPPSPSGDWLDDYLVAAAIVRSGVYGAKSPGAVALLEGAAARHPVANMFGLIAEVEGDDGLLSAADIEGLRHAHESAPARDDYAFALAQALAMSGHYADARNVLGTVIGHPHWKSSRDSAMRMMRAIVLRERSENELASAPAQQAQTDVEDASATDPKKETAVDDGASREPERNVQPVYRAVQTGEHRAEGLLEQVTCDAGKPAVVTVRFADRVGRYEAARLTDIEFISYQSSKTGRFACGRRLPPDRVYVTWKAGANGVDTVVAVEFLPKKR